METIAENILSPKFIQEELTEKVRLALARKWTVPILNYLHDHVTGVGFRTIDVEVLGKEGSGSTTRSTLKTLIQMGWVEQKKRGPYKLTALGSAALTYAHSGDELTSNGNKGEGDSR